MKIASFSLLISSVVVFGTELRGSDEAKLNRRRAQVPSTPVGGTVQELRWIDANSNQRVALDGTSLVPIFDPALSFGHGGINGYEVPNVPLTMEAVIVPNSGPVGSIKFTFLDSSTNALVTTIENTAPYALCGNAGTDFFACNGLREHGGKVTAQVFSGQGATGTSGPELVTWIVYKFPAAPFFNFLLYNADTNAIISGTPGPSNGISSATVSLTATPSIAVGINNFGGPHRWWPQSVRFDYDNGSQVVAELNAPFVFPGNTGTDYLGVTPAIGSHTLAATLYSKPNLQGQTTTQTFELTVVA